MDSFKPHPLLYHEMSLATAYATSFLPEGSHSLDTEKEGLQHLLAGAVAGVAEHAVMFPVDTIKTRMQALAHPGQRVSPPDAVLCIMLNATREVC